MSTDHMPKPPDQPTEQANAPSVPSQAVAPIEQTGAEAVAKEAEPLDIGADMARIMEEQVEVIVQRQVYHTQMMFGVSGLGTDPVNARNATLTIAGALRNKTPEIVLYTLVNLGDAQLSQINDQSIPFKFNVQVAGLLEGILIDTINQAYKGDPPRQHEARTMLEQMFIDANEQAETHPKSVLMFQAPAPDPEIQRQLT